MKHIVLSLIICLIPIISQAQSISSAIQLNDGTIFDCSHIFIDGETLSFHAQDVQSGDIFWTLSFYNKYGGETVCIKSDEGLEKFSFTIAPSLFSGLNLTSNCQLVEHPNDSSVYIACSVELHQRDIVIDRVPITLNVLPSRPKIKEASIAGNFDFEIGGYKPLTELTVLFSAERMDECRLVHFVSDSDSESEFQFPESYVVVSESVDINEKRGNHYEFKYDYADWGEFYTIGSYNKYGAIVGDTIFTNSLIDDPEILSYLEALRNQSSALNEVQNDDCQFSIHNNELIIEGLHNDQISAEIFSVNGISIKRYSSTNALDLNDLHRGIYVVKIELNNKVYYKKITKK